MARSPFNPVPPTTPTVARRLPNRGSMNKHPRSSPVTDRSPTVSLPRSARIGNSEKRWAEAASQVPMSEDAVRIRFDPRPTSGGIRGSSDLFTLPRQITRPEQPLGLGRVRWVRRALQSCHRGEHGSRGGQVGQTRLVRTQGHHAANGKVKQAHDDPAHLETLAHPWRGLYIGGQKVEAAPVFVGWTRLRRYQDDIGSGVTSRRSPQARCWRR